MSCASRDNARVKIDNNFTLAEVVCCALVSGAILVVLKGIFIQPFEFTGVVFFYIAAVNFVVFTAAMMTRRKGVCEHDPKVVLKNILIGLWLFGTFVLGAIAPLATIIPLLLYSPDPLFNKGVISLSWLSFAVFLATVAGIRARRKQTPEA